MKKKILLLFLVLFSFSQVNLSFTDDENFLGKHKINNNLEWTKKPLVETINLYIKFLLSFLAIISTIYWLYWGFQIFTATDDDEKVKKGKKIIIQAVIWLVLIFLAGPIANFFLWETWILNETSSWKP